MVPKNLCPALINSPGVKVWFGSGAGAGWASAAGHPNANAISTIWAARIARIAHSFSSALPRHRPSDSRGLFHLLFQTSVLPQLSQRNPCIAGKKFVRGKERMSLTFERHFGHKG